ncbi:MAG: hypothetical protein KF724_01565 [Phycisphaeraceae bacterium]|nr:hypothetical protein [Phycisphaeraceae bacterium]
MAGDALQPVTVEIRQCVHYAAFRYGHSEYHPYERYLIRLHRGDPIESIREEFHEFLRHFRPRHMGELLGVQLSRRYPLWSFPWLGFWPTLRIRRDTGWHTHPRDVPDVITHFSEGGISRARIELEYGWLHGAYDALVREGYRPDLYGRPRVQLLKALDGRVAALVLDGNHRIGTLSALGHERIEVDHAPADTIDESHLDRWWGVRLRRYRRDDARRVLHAYFEGNHAIRTAGATPSHLVD